MNSSIICVFVGILTLLCHATYPQEVRTEHLVPLDSQESETADRRLLVRLRQSALCPTVYPPSTMMLDPVMKLLSSEARNRLA